MAASGSKPNTKQSTSDSLLENRWKHDAIVRKESNSTANGYQKTSTTVVRTSVQTNRVVSSTTSQSVSISGSNHIMRLSPAGNSSQQGASAHQGKQSIPPKQVSVPTKTPRSYSPAYKSRVYQLGTGKPQSIDSNTTGHYTPHRPHQLPISATVPAAGKYDLSKKAYVLVLHHYSFDNSEHNRPGSDKDMAKIRRFFQHYRVDPLNVKDNQTVIGVRKIMDKIALHNFSNNSCLITIIMSHGDENDQIMARDGKMYGFEGDIVEKCTSNKTLDGKPKLFIVQACRGESTVATDSKKTQSNKNDVLIFQSTYKGFVAFRDTQNGSFFIQNFFELLNEHRDEDISLINKHLNRVFAQNGISQNPTMSTTLQKDFVFADLRML